MASYLYNKMSLEQQKFALQSIKKILFTFAFCGYIVGYIHQNFLYTLCIFGAGIVLSMVLFLPNFNFVPQALRNHVCSTKTTEYYKELKNLK